jgi:hypothetical protein
MIARFVIWKDGKPIQDDRLVFCEWSAAYETANEQLVLLIMDGDPNRSPDNHRYSLSFGSGGLGGPILTANQGASALIPSNLSGGNGALSINSAGPVSNKEILYAEFFSQPDIKGSPLICRSEQDLAELSKGNDKLALAVVLEWK